MYTLLRNWLVFSCWVSHRAAGETKPDADRLAGEQMGCSARTVRNKRSKIENTVSHFPGLAGQLEQLTA